MGQIKNVWLVILGLSLQVAHAADNSRTSVHRTKLILAVASDQFRYDCTTRFRGRYTGGLATMLSRGPVFVGAHQDHFPTVTAWGHDSHVPLIFYGSKVTAGVYAERVGISDVAPTLAAILQVETRSGNVGHVLSQVAKPFLG